MIPAWGNLPVEMAAMLAGVKPVTHAWIDAADLPRLRALARLLGARTLVYSRPEATTGGRLGVMIGRRLDRLEACAATWSARDANPGPLLGYPICCVRRFRKLLISDMGGEDFVVHALRATRAGPLPWMLNDVYYMYSRPFRDDHPAKRSRVAALNPGLPVDLLNLISWHPCRYSCSKSLAYAGATYAAMRRHMPGLAELVSAALARPVLFWDWWRFAVLGGARSRGGRVSFAALEKPLTPLDPADRRALDGGGVLSARGARWSVRRESGTLRPLTGRPVYLDFR